MGLSLRMGARVCPDDGSNLVGRAWKLGRGCLPFVGVKDGGAEAFGLTTYWSI